MKKIGFLMMLMAISTFSFGQKSKKVAYTVAKNYYCTVNGGAMVFPKITSEKEFDKLFGAATLMGKNGTPTAIDFSKQYVIAVVDYVSSSSEGLDPVSLTKLGDQITFTFSKKESSNNGSATYRRFLILIVDKKNEGEVIIKDTNGVEYLSYTIANRYFVKNTIENKEQILTNITSEEFNNYFGMATVMGEDGQPTSIDFSKQFVIGIINESSDDEVNYSYMVTRENNTTTVVYSTEGGAPGESFRYCSIIILDKKYGDKVEVSKKIKD